MQYIHMQWIIAKLMKGIKQVKSFTLKKHLSITLFFKDFCVCLFYNLTDNLGGV